MDLGVGLLTFLFAALLAANLNAATLNGRVVGITDGDTIVVIDADRARHKVRLAAVDAPEPKQAFGTRAKQNLSNMVFGKDVSIEWKKRDRNERIVGKVWVQPTDCPTCGKTLDAGHAQIIAGFAWWYRTYAKEQSAEDQGRYKSAEDEAGLRKWGLWGDAEPVPPWEWRKLRR